MAFRSIHLDHGQQQISNVLTKTIAATGDLGTVQVLEGQTYRHQVSQLEYT